MWLGIPDHYRLPPRHLPIGFVGPADGDDGMGRDPAREAQDQHVEVLAAELGLPVSDVGHYRVSVFRTYCSVRKGKGKQDGQKGRISTENY